jgi:hypothetical protein
MYTKTKEWRLNEKRDVVRHWSSEWPNKTNAVHLQNKNKKTG